VNLRDLLAVGTVILRLGPGRVILNVVHRLRLRSGWYGRRCRSGPLRTAPAAVLHGARTAFAIPEADERAMSAYRDDACRSADRIVGGELQYFSHEWLQRRSTWRESPSTGHTVALDHWSKLTDFDPAVGDIKWIWDASRFDWAYALGRAWRYSHDEKYAQCFWGLLEDWIADNPVNLGPNWKCGQECGLRLLALSWSAGVFASATASTTQRIETLWSLVAALAERVRASLLYAVSQNNNHLLSEALALYAAATSLPGHRQAREWHAVGRRQFVRAMLHQFAPDGYYALHSWTYSRAALRTVLMFIAVAKHRGEAVPAAVLTRCESAAGLMRSMMDTATGRLPNYGGNDGSNIAAMNNCDYLDFRPVVTAAFHILRGERAFADPLVQEELLWSVGAQTPRSGETISNAGEGALQSGYFRLDGPTSRVYVRCGRYRTRPAHADLLHTDIWFGNRNIASDAGTYQYLDEHGWGVRLEGSAAHNVVTIDNADQMRRYSRFLWVVWARGRVLHRARDAGEVSWAGEHDGYRRLGVMHRREIRGSEDRWRIVDDILQSGGAVRHAVLRWHLCPTLNWRATATGVESAVNCLRVEVAAPADATFEVLEGADALPEGAESRYFGSLAPRTTLRVSVRASGAIRFVTSIGVGQGGAL
jgi:hypothetical protein